MKIKNIIFSLCVILSAVSFISPNICCALTAKEKYSMCFSAVKPGMVSVQNLTDEDKGELAKLISDTDGDMAKYLGSGYSLPDVSQMINDISDDDIKLTVRSPEGYVVGQIILACDDESDFHVIYWIGQDFRKRGYMSSALNIAMQKIWEIDSSVRFFFAIDDENIASIKTLDSVCADLQSNLAICESHKMEVRVSKIDDAYYNIQLLEDEVEIGSYPILKNQLLFYFPKKIIEDGRLVTANVTQYMVSR